MRGKNSKGTATDYLVCSTINFTNPEVSVECTGDIRMLLDYKTYKTVETQYARFCNLFKNCTVLTSAPVLPAKTLTNECYSGMFEGCTSLKTAPALPAETLNSCCYYCMFEGCTKLETAPALPATQLAEECYASMFSGCIKLNTAPDLPATKLAYSCYESMFSGCTTLIKAPDLLATQLAEYCYFGMFNDCTNLTSVTMLAPSEEITNQSKCCYGWLCNAGTQEGITRTLKVKDEAAYNALLGVDTYLPAIWQKDGPCNVSW